MHTDSISSSPWRPLPCRGPEAQLFVLGDEHGQAGALSAALNTEVRHQIGIFSYVGFYGAMNFNGLGISKGRFS